MTQKRAHVFFFTKDTSFARLIGEELGETFEVRTAPELTDAVLESNEAWVDVALLDIRGAETEAEVAEGLQLIRTINKSPLPPPTVVMLRAGDDALTPRLMENGAYDTVTSPPNMMEVRLILRRACNFQQGQRELNHLRSQDPANSRLLDLIGASECMQQIFSLARKIAPCDVNVLVTGETGTGKELLARAVHRLSHRANGPFVAFSCASLPETLIEDELFGHERGAFTGALNLRRGRFETADQGTLFLDEIGDLSLELQSKLLRVLQVRSFERLGSNTSVSVNIRLISATHRNLPEMVERGQFREDLYYRLNVMQLHLPPLRERRDDILFLAHYFLREAARQFGKKCNRFSRLALHALEEHQWRGNVRELENTVQRGVVLAEGSCIEIWHLPAQMRGGFEHPKVIHSYDEEVRDFKRRLVMRTLRECNWRKAETARTLCMARGYLHRLINQFQIVPEAEPEVIKPPEPAQPSPLRRVM